MPGGVPSEHRPATPPRSTRSLLFDSAAVMAENVVPLYGVWRHGWSSFLLILLFVIEGAIAVVTDIVKQAVRPQKAMRGILPIELAFILFFGTMAVLIFGRDADSGDLLQTATSSFRRASALPLWPVASILAVRLARTIRDLWASGALGGRGAETLRFSGMGWILLVFFLVMTAPFVADRSPNPTAGLVVIILLKSAGELLEIWGTRLPARPRGRRSRPS